MKVLALVLFAASCNGGSSSRAAPSTGTPAPPAKSGDIVVLPVKTDAGGEVIAIGQPKLQLANDAALGGLAIAAKAGIAVVEDAQDVIVWDLANGTTVARITPLPGPAYLATTIAVSPDGTRIATASGDKTRVFARPFTTAEQTIPCSTVDAFSHDGKFLLCHSRLPQVWDLTAKRVVATAPDAALPRSPRKAGFAADDRSVYWSTDHEIQRWDYGSGAVASVFKAKDELQNVAFASGGAKAFVSTRPAGSYKFAGSVVDLRDGKAAPVGSSYQAGLSADGARVAIEEAAKLEVREGGKVVWSAPAPHHLQRIAFSEDANVFGYVVDQRLVIVDIPKGPRTYEAPVRFAGWAADGVIAVERAGKTEQVVLADRSRKPGGVDAAVKPAGAPAWATWSSAAVAAEPRGETCTAKLRVWTPEGGEKSLAMTCASGDPGWELGGSVAVAVAAKRTTVYDASTGKPMGTVEVDKPWLDKPAFARAFSRMAVSPKGNYLALVSVGPKLPPQGNADPREDAMHQQVKIECEMAMGECVSQYVLSVYALGGVPAKVWQAPIDAPSAVAFDRAGDRLLVGTQRGEVQVFDAGGKAEPRVERFHRGPVTRIASGPGDTWVFSEDAAGQQRVWKSSSAAK